MDQSSHIAEELYKKNLELTERNKTLALLRKIDEIILSKVTDIEEVVRQIAQAVVAEAGLKAVYIFLLNKKESLLTPHGISLSKSINDVDPNLQRAMFSVKISWNDDSNLIIKAIKERKMYQTESLYNLFKSIINEKACRKIQDTVDMKSFLIYPLVAREEAIGSMIISPREENQPYFAYQKDLIDRLPEVISIALDNSLLYDRIQRANLRLMELDKLKDEFVSLASHELRTPMTAVKSYLWMVLNKSNSLDPQIRSYLEIASAETEHLIKLVQNMLTISRIEGKRLELNIDIVNLFDLVMHSYNTLKVKAGEKNITITLLPYPEKLMVSGDKDKLSEVFENIIGNALKYTPNKGSVSIYFTIEKNKIAARVSDTGPGISKQNLPKLFQKFGRLEEAKQNRTPGTGLGLYISKQIVELHKGTIKVESEVGKGTVFTVYLPMV
ncbi:GAF domain-containing sensor histidine kinase [Candidatus Roizmanbacteria bacterium]|nr:GAF domain-containing sensor histidine kinase [Candidatus Roizmanbacteria bacterium]